MNREESKDFFAMLKELNPDSPNLVMTVIDDKHMGEKAIISNHEIIWKSCEKGFFSENGEEVARREENGIMESGGCRVFCEMIGQEKKMVICGGGHVSIPIISMGVMMGYHVTVLEDRPKFADHARRAGATEVLCEPFEEGLKKIEGDENTFFIIVTRGHRYDQVCLESIAKKRHAYIGMIGSRRRVALVKESLIKGGANPQVIQQVYTPIGLNIGAETPEEIAVAIMAEVIEVKNRRKKHSGYSKEIMRAIQENAGEKEAKILATIVLRKGSAPREAGAKMLILSDGSCVGTIGGGCVESDIYQKALRMLKLGETRPRLCHVDMTGEEAEEEGMVCGGVIDVFLETI